jgi:hypothetical protein
MTQAASPRFHAAAHEQHKHKKPLFVSPPAAGRKITAGFSFLQRIGKSASIDVWFPDQLQKELDQLVDQGRVLGADDFPAEWAAVRQFELLQDAGNYKIYDMHADYITRSLYELTRSMRGGGYRVTVATIGSYVSEQDKDDLEILDQHLQKRISHLIHMLYLEEQSETINRAMDEALAEGCWDYQSALPHVGVTLGARDLFRREESEDAKKRKKGKKGSGDGRRFALAKKFFEILEEIPNRQIVHDTAVGLQLPEMINEQEWIYLTASGETVGAFNTLLKDLFTPFDGINMAALDGRADAKPEVKATTQHLRGHGDRLTPESDKFYRALAQYSC